MSADASPACPVCGWSVDPESASAADELAVVVDPRRDEVQVRGTRLGRLHGCPAATLPRDVAGRYVAPA